jgi:hypothetical protein
MTFIFLFNFLFPFFKKRRMCSHLKEEGLAVWPTSAEEKGRL